VSGSPAAPMRLSVAFVRRLRRNRGQRLFRAAKLKAEAYGRRPAHRLPHDGWPCNVLREAGFPVDNERIRKGVAAASRPITVSWPLVDRFRSTPITGITHLSRQRHALLGLGPVRTRLLPRSLSGITPSNSFAEILFFSRADDFLVAPSFPLSRIGRFRRSQPPPF